MSIPRTSSPAHGGTRRRPLAWTSPGTRWSVPSTSASPDPTVRPTTCSPGRKHGSASSTHASPAVAPLPSVQSLRTTPTRLSASASTPSAITAAGARSARTPDGGKHVELILAHQLETEALRVLLPVATALIDERVASFAAALMAGVAKKYGGDPDHLAIITATMPDQETGRRRRFLVLHDTLRGGTGYLHRLADKDEFREVLQDCAHRRRGMPVRGRGPAGLPPLPAQPHRRRQMAAGLPRRGAVHAG